MNREIKFRAWNGKKMLEPQDISQSGKYWSWLGKEDVQLMQYTGLKDKNGKEIYEGDILKLYNIKKEPYNRIVKWHVGGMWWAHENDAFYMGFYKPNENFEIIGNIYENPELLTPPRTT